MFEVLFGETYMPVISAFYGILIKMFYNDHSPPHFHAEYAEFEAVINIATLEKIESQLPRHAELNKNPIK